VKNTSADDHLVELECAVTNQDGESKLEGIAIASLPSKG
jgi:hypothetical protein